MFERPTSTRSLMGLPVVATRRPLEGGTLLADFLGESNLLTRTRKLERRADEMDTVVLSSTAAEQVYTRRRGALFLAGWGQSSVPASQTNVTLSRFGSSLHGPLVLPFAGSVTALMVCVSSQQTAGSLTVKVYISGSASGMEAVIDSENRLTVEETASRGTYEFDAGEPITVRISTTGWSPTSADAYVMLEVSGE